MQKKYDHAATEKKWQKKWDEAALYVADIDNAGSLSYNLSMFPYPSAYGRYDWPRTVTASDPDYYKWTQWFVVKMFEAGLAYKKKATVNFCPSCKTVLADEQEESPKAAGIDPK